MTYSNMAMETGNRSDIEQSLGVSRGLYADILAEQPSWDFLGYDREQYKELVEYIRSLLKSHGEVAFGIQPTLHLGEDEGIIERHKVLVGLDPQQATSFDVSSFVVRRSDKAPNSGHPIQGLPDRELLRLNLISNAQQAVTLSATTLAGILYSRSNLFPHNMYLARGDQGIPSLLINGVIPRIVRDKVNRPDLPADGILHAEWTDEKAKLLMKVTEQMIIPPQQSRVRFWRRLNGRAVGQEAWLPIGLKVQKDPELPERHTVGIKGDIFPSLA